MTPYADTNFLVRLYLDLPNSESALALTGRRTRDDLFPVTWLLRLETCNAIQLRVFQRDATRRQITPEQAALAWGSFAEDVRTQNRLKLMALSIADMDRQFEELSLRHTARHGFRTYDLIHVASALLLECDTFWSFDAKASKLASLEGFKVPRMQT